MRRVGLILAGCLALTAATAGARAPGLDAWTESELIPSVRSTLESHPRFKGETIMIVALRDNRPATVADALTLALRDRLLDALIDAESVRIGWSQQQAAKQDSSRLDCTQSDIDYYVGIDIDETFGANVEVRVRVLDLRENAFVAAFPQVWRGQLTSAQRHAWRTTQVDESFRGSRDAPFAASQSDLLAETLARSLSCDLLRQTAGEYRIGPSIADDEGALDGTLDLVRNNLITHASLALTADAGQSNATLIGEAHPIDGALHQYWLTVVPRVADGELRSLSASAYVVLPNAGLASVGPEPQPLPAPSAAVPASLSIPNAGNAAMLGPLRVSVPESTDDCGALQPSMTPASRWHVQHDCSVLEAESLQDAIVFVLQHQPQLGLVRLGGAACRHRTTARVVRRGERLRFPIAWLRPQGGNVRPAADWLKSPQRDTYYAIALSDSRTARRLANHIDALPLRCSTSLKPGLTGLRLQHWFDEFAALAASSASHLDWRGVELKDVY